MISAALVDSGGQNVQMSSACVSANPEALGKPHVCRNSQAAASGFA